MHAKREVMDPNEKRLTALEMATSLDDTAPEHLGASQLTKVFLCSCSYFCFCFYLFFEVRAFD